MKFGWTCFQFKHGRAIRRVQLDLDRTCPAHPKEPKTFWPTRRCWWRDGCRRGTQASSAKFNNGELRIICHYVYVFIILFEHAATTSSVKTSNMCSALDPVQIQVPLSMLEKRQQTMCRAKRGGNGNGRGHPMSSPKLWSF